MEAASLPAHNNDIAEQLRSRRTGDPMPDLRGARLSGQDLSGCDLSGCDLTGAQLGGANLAGARFVGSTLADASLFGAKLTGAEFLSANLRGADLSECTGEQAGFGSADLSGATFFDAKLPGSTFIGAKLSGADFRAADLTGSRLREADLGDADFSRANLTGADLEACRLAGTIFRKADLHNMRLQDCTEFDKADWIDAKILGVDFTRAFMARRFIMDQNYLHEFRSHSRTNEVLYRLWWITSDCGRSFLRWGLWTAFLAAVFAGLYQFVAIDYGDHPTFLSSFYFSVVTLTTLGYGDVQPASAPAQALAMVEVAIGYVMLGGLMSIFANKMARRAE